MTTTPFFGEFVGTLVLVLLGDGVVACVLLKRSKGEASGWIAITTGWALAVMAGVFAPTACGSTDASLKLGVFCTAPAIRNVAANLISEIIGTFVLVLIAGAIFAKAVAKDGPAAGLGPYLVGCLVWAIGLSLGGTTGYAINPARDLGPRIAHAVLPISGKGHSDWGYAAIPVVGPLMGASLAGLLLHALHI